MKAIEHDCINWLSFTARYSEGSVNPKVRYSEGSVNPKMK